MIYKVLSDTLTQVSFHALWRGLVIALDVLFAAMVAAVVAQGATQPQPNLPMIEADSDFVSPEAGLELLVRGEDFGMVLIGDAKMGCDSKVYFSDIPFSGREGFRDEQGRRKAGAIWVYDPEMALAQVFRSPSGMTNGIAFDAACNMVTAEGADFGGRRIIWTDSQTGLAKIVAGLFENASFNAPNDLVIDELGRIYFTDSRYNGHEPVEQEVMGVYRIDPDGTVERIITDIQHPNGIAIAPDQNTLYVANFSNQGTTDALLAYDLHEDGTATFRQVLVAYPAGGTDGLVVDTEGNLWAAVLDSERPGVYAYSPRGMEKAYIRVFRPYNVGFGRGEHRNVLYIAAGSNLYRITVRKQGYHLP
jgi:gluconolactonase